MKLMSFIVGAEQSILCSWVNKFHANIAGDRSFVFFHAKLGSSLLKYNLQKQRHELNDVSNITFICSVSVAHTLSIHGITYRLIIPSDHQVFIPSPSHSAFI